MNVPRNLRFPTFAISALLAVLCVLMIPMPTSSEPNVGAHQQNDGGKSPKTIGKPGYTPPRSAWSRLYPTSDDCAAAKVDIWLERGVATYSIFVPGAGIGGQRAVARVGGGEDGTTMLIGAKDCLIRVRIERAPAGTTIDGN